MTNSVKCILGLIISGANHCGICDRPGSLKIFHVYSTTSATTLTTFRLPPKYPRPFPQRPPSTHRIGLNTARVLVTILIILQVLPEDLGSTHRNAKDTRRS
ncbi:hypothetical protein DL98DRAFT_22706 [Cadophora sp. DSE1049]|nr:hypothetical protein DL98DRAFT_22706 [Cadophora sp. DSE1049]